MPQYFARIQHFLSMLSDNSGFSSEEDDSFKDQEFKKIDYKGHGFDSGMSDDSLSESESKKMTQLNKNNVSNKSLSFEDKSKVIKKNRQSAKMSRMRKKQYQQKLEQKVGQLQSEISQRKANIKSISNKIFNKFLRSNKDKHKYLVEKLACSKHLLSLVNQIKNLKQPVSKDPKFPSNMCIEQQKSQLVKSQSNPNNTENVNADHVKEQAKKGKQRKKKCGNVCKKGEEKEQQSKHGIEQKIAQKEVQLEMCLKNYMHQFGMKGCLRTDVLQRSKYEWLQAINTYNPYPTEQICNGVAKMKTCLQKLENKSKLLDFHLRQLRAKVKDKYALQFMLDKEFFAYNSAQTIYKNTQFKNLQR